jgi:hypothetical protein
MILTWTCEFCGWSNDNNDGPCRKCGGHTEKRMVKGRWRTVLIQQPRPPDPPDEAT